MFWIGFYWSRFSNTLTSHPLNAFFFSSYTAPKLKPRAWVWPPLDVFVCTPPPEGVPIIQLFFCLFLFTQNGQLIQRVNVYNTPKTSIVFDVFLMYLHERFIKKILFVINGLNTLYLQLCLCVGWMLRPSRKRLPWPHRELSSHACGDATRNLLCPGETNVCVFDSSSTNEAPAF